MEVLLVQVQHVNPVPYLGSASESQDLVDRHVPEAQAPAQLRVWLDGKKTDCAVHDPFNLRLLSTAENERPAEGLVSATGLNHFETGSAQRGQIAVSGFGQAFRGVVKHVQVFGNTWRGGVLVQDRGPPEVAVGVSFAASRRSTSRSKAPNGIVPRPSGSPASPHAPSGHE